MGFIKSGALRSSANFLLLFCFFSEKTSAQDNGGTHERVRHTAIEEYAQGHFGEAETLFLHALHLAETKRDEYSVALSLSGLVMFTKTKDISRKRSWRIEVAFQSLSAFPTRISYWRLFSTISPTHIQLNIDIRTLWRL